MSLRPIVLDIELWTPLGESGTCHWALLLYNTCLLARVYLI